MAECRRRMKTMSHEGEAEPSRIRVKVSESVESLEEAGKDSPTLTWPSWSVGPLARASQVLSGHSATVQPTHHRSQRWSADRLQRATACRWTLMMTGVCELAWHARLSLCHSAVRERGRCVPAKPLQEGISDEVGSLRYFGMAESIDVEEAARLRSEGVRVVSIRWLRRYRADISKLEVPGCVL